MRATVTLDRKSVSLITDVPAARMYTGSRRRVEHLIDCLKFGGVEYELRSIFDSRPLSGGFRGSARAASGFANEYAASVATQDRVFVAGFGSLALTFLAVKLHRSGYQVVFDQCDSLLLQLGKAIRARQILFATHALCKVAAWALSSRRIPISYISEADRRHDRILNVFRDTFVVGPTVPQSLRSMQPVIGAIDRVVSSGDFYSHHVARGTSYLLASARNISGLRIDLYGPRKPPEQLPEGVTYHGFADELEELYLGNTAVFIPNIRGTGIPNKLVEAIASGRPVIVHKSLLALSLGPAVGWTWESGEDIRDILGEILEGGAARALDFPQKPVEGTEVLWARWAKPVGTRTLAYTRRASRRPAK